MGDAVEVRLSRVDLMQRQIDFDLVESGAGSHADAGSLAAPRAGQRPGSGAGG